MADELMKARIIDSSIGLSKQPNISANTIITRGENLVNSAMAFTIRVGKAKLNGQGLEGKA
ncbi:hypothetical protein AMTR_s00103p00053370 [Amborella trichopoda]|uniref:Uncharacterized protein n=1 Tax=Amborella trichopoda TaxID=13333 RepID=W1NTI8_AMBTC|nr:hypothetical protein AMTR_s00103p00053370 [Amborella trichopoda]